MRRKRKEMQEQQKAFIEKFLKENFSQYNSENLDKRIKEIENIEFLEEVNKIYHKDIEDKLTEAKRVLKEIQHKERIEYLKEEKGELESEIGELKHEKVMESNDKETKKREIKRELNLEENKVFIKDELNKEEIEVLLENSYRYVNEYDVEEKKMVSILIKPTLNHSKTHTFLVWSLSNLLQFMEGVEDVKEHETRDADITFDYKGKTYAIEVETGTLLGKKKQTQEKLNYLNRKYPGRWMFVVSNKNLLPAYRKLGPATSRNEVAKRLEKMLKNSTRN